MRIYRNKFYRLLIGNCIFLNNCYLYSLLLRWLTRLVKNVLSLCLLKYLFCNCSSVTIYLFYLQLGLLTRITSLLCIGDKTIKSNCNCSFCFRSINQSLIDVNIRQICDQFNSGYRNAWCKEKMRGVSACLNF